MTRRELIGLTFLAAVLILAVAWATWEWQGPVLAKRVDDLEAQQLGELEARVAVLEGNDDG